MDLLIRIDTVEGLVAAHRTSEAMEELEGMRSVTDDLYQDVSESISMLRTRVSERGLPATIREYVDAYEDRHGLSVRLEVEAIASTLPALIAFQLLQIILALRPGWLASIRSMTTSAPRCNGASSAENRSWVCLLPVVASRIYTAGTGPFKLDSLTPGVEMRLVRNPDYWRSDSSVSRRYHSQELA
jgi:hypothetical protein